MKEDSMVYHLISLGIGIIIYAGTFFSDYNSLTIALIDIVAVFLILGGLVGFLQRFIAVVVNWWDKITKRTP